MIPSLPSISIHSFFPPSLYHKFIIYISQFSTCSCNILRHFACGVSSSNRTNFNFTSWPLLIRVRTDSLWLSLSKLLPFTSIIKSCNWICRERWADDWGTSDFMKTPLISSLKNRYEIKSDFIRMYIFWFKCLRFSLVNNFPCRSFLFFMTKKFKFLLSEKNE